MQSETIEAADTTESNVDAKKALSFLVVGVAGIVIVGRGCGQRRSTFDQKLE